MNHLVFKPLILSRKLVCDKIEQISHLSPSFGRRLKKSADK